MEITVYNEPITEKVLLNNINRISDRIFKLLPIREEGRDWKNSLHNLLIEVVGLNKILEESGQTILFNVIIKMKALETLDKPEDFFDFRKVIFECLSLMNKLKKWVD
jgi:hypothetical protein